MEKIQLGQNAWFDIDECIGQYDPNKDPHQEFNYRGMVIYETKNNNFITRYRRHSGGCYGYKKSTEGEIGLYKNQYAFPPEEEM